MTDSQLRCGIQYLIKIFAKEKILAIRELRELLGLDKTNVVKDPEMEAEEIRRFVNAAAESQRNTLLLESNNSNGSNGKVKV